MQRIVLFQDAEIATVEDFSNLGLFARESTDAVVKDLGGFPSMRYSGLLVEQTAGSVVRVGPGLVYKPNGSVFMFQHEGGQSIDMIAELPAVAKRVATIVAYGNAIDTNLQEREFLQDADNPDNDATISQQMPVESRRQGYVGAVYGAENPTPAAPNVQSDYVAIAHVILTPAGIESITQITGNRVGSIRENAEKITLIDNRLAAVGPQIDTLKTDISALGVGLGGKADQGFVVGLALDMARVKDKVDLPDDYAAYGGDYFLDDSESDPDHPDFVCRLDEGVRFPAAATATVPIALENPIDTKVMVNNNMALPRWSATTRASVVGNDSSYALANTTVETVETRQVTETRTVRKMLGSERVCTNSRAWESGLYDPETGIFTRDGETFIILDMEAKAPSRNPRNTYVPFSQNWWRHNYKRVTLQKYVDVTITDTHWEEVSTEETIQGSIAAQTILNSQDGYLVGLNLFFDKKAAAGDVRVLICDVDQTDNPMLSRVLAEATLAPADIKVWPEKTPVSLKPTFMPKGSRFAIVEISAGAHFVALVHDNRFSQGVIRYMVDGEWQTGDATKDFAFELMFAQFDAPVVTVQLTALELAGGIDSLTINADTSIPAGTAIEFEVRVNGVWKALTEAGSTNILSSHPSIAQFRAVFMGTTDVMPALGLGASRSAVTLVRPDNDMTHVSSPRLLPAAMDQVDVMMRVENWDFDEHSLTLTLLTGETYATVETADAVSIVPARDDPDGSVIITATFIVVDVEQFKIKAVGSIGASARYFHIAERTDIEFVNAI